MRVEPHQIADEASEIGRLERLGGQDPAGPAIAAFAEAHRRAGEPEKALELADEGLASQPDLVAARIARALALLDLKRSEEARLELESVLEIVGDHPVARTLLEEGGAGHGTDDDFAPVAEAELDDAFGAAETETDEMVSANDFAEAAIHAVEEQPDASDDLIPVDPAEVDPSEVESAETYAAEASLELEADSPFATATVAGLLAEQGHEDQARELRQSLDHAADELAPAATDAETASEGRLLTTLERWLDNLRKQSR